MRLISQNGNVDIPYEQAHILCNMECVMARVGNYEYILGKYSHKNKALKVMEMLREQYMKLGMIKILASGTCEYMDKSLKKEEKMDIYTDYCRKHCFKFPDDEEVEV